MIRKIMHTFEKEEIKFEEFAKGGRNTCVIKNGGRLFFLQKVVDAENTIHFYAKRDSFFDFEVENKKNQLEIEEVEYFLSINEEERYVFFANSYVLSQLITGKPSYEEESYRKELSNMFMGYKLCSLWDLNAEYEREISKEILSLMLEERKRLKDSGNYEKLFNEKSKKLSFRTTNDLSLDRTSYEKLIKNEEKYLHCYFFKEGENHINTSDLHNYLTKERFVREKAKDCISNKDEEVVYERIFHYDLALEQIASTLANPSEKLVALWEISKKIKEAGKTLSVKTKGSEEFVKVSNKISPYGEFQTEKGWNWICVLDIEEIRFRNKTLYKSNS